MHKLIAALVLACALTFAATASAVDFGANDDTGKYAEDGGAEFFAQMACGRAEAERDHRSLDARVE